MEAERGDRQRERIRRRYAQLASAAQGCQPARRTDDDDDEPQARFGLSLYETAELVGELPEEERLASLGCGNPIALVELREGDVVLDLGSGGGLDVILSAKRVGPSGVAYGLDMTDEMLALAADNAARAGVTNVRFLKGEIEAVPLAAARVDVVISNCVINLATDKARVFKEIARVLKPGGRIGISDIVAEEHLTEEQRTRAADVGCVSGVLSANEYERSLRSAGFEQISIVFTHEVVERIHAASVRARKPRTSAGAGGEATLDWEGSRRC